MIPITSKVIGIVKKPIYYASVINKLFNRYHHRTVNLLIMKRLIFCLALGSGFTVLAQTSDNEILAVAQKRADCVERSLCKVSVYPNPSAGPVHVDAPKGAQCKIYSVTGTYVGTWEVGETGLDLIDLPSGSFIAAVTYNGITRSSRIMIL